MVSILSRIRSKIRLLTNKSLTIGKLDETSLKHRSAVLVLSAMVFFVSPEAKLTFGNASLAGLGISVTPPQVLPVGWFLVALLLYRLIAFWMSILIGEKTDLGRAKWRALRCFAPEYTNDEDEPGNPEAMAIFHAKYGVSQWSRIRALWEIAIPSVMGVLAFLFFLYK